MQYSLFDGMELEKSIEEVFSEYNDVVPQKKNIA
jgi:hypothetical protein